jgi:hypothetical protein
MVANACNPSYLGGEHRRIVVQGQPGQKASETLLPRTSIGVVVHSPNSNLDTRRAVSKVT